jgi:hypothetical protein
MLEASWDWGGGSSGGPRALHLLRMNGASSIWYRLGSATSASTLTPTSSMAYTQPFGNNGLLESETFSDDAQDLVSEIIGRRNCSGIFIDFKGIEDASCQHRGLCTIEVKPLHALGWNGSLHLESRLGRGEVERWVRDEGGVSVAIFLLFSTASTASEIIVGG